MRARRKTLAVFFLLLATFQSAASFAHTTCGRILLEGRFDEFHRLISEEREAVIRAVRSRDDSDPLNEHWAATYAGDIISSRVDALVEISQQIHFKKGATLIDIGSGHGEPGLVFGALNPDLNVIGYDIVPEKVEGANQSAAKLGIVNARFEVRDLSRRPPPIADYYYLFNPVKPEVLRQIVNHVRADAGGKDAKFIVYSGGWTHNVLKDAGFSCTQRIPTAYACVYSLKAQREDARIGLIPGKSGEYLLKVYKAVVHELTALDWPTRDSEQWEEYERVAGLEKALLAGIAHLPAEKRHPLINQTLVHNKWNKNNRLLDALFGLRIAEMDNLLKDTIGNSDRRRELFGDEEIWYAPGGGQQTDWLALKAHIEDMNLRPGDHVVDIGSGIGRLGLLLGFLRPDVQFTGLELIPERVRYAQQAANALGFANVTYITTNLAEENIPLPLADHYYLFNPTNRETSDIVTQKLLRAKESKKFRVHFHTGFASQIFHQHFEQVAEGRGRIFAPRWKLEELFPFTRR